MQEIIRERLVKNGIDMDAAMQHFMNNETLYIKFLKKFISDSTMKELTEAMESGDAVEAFHAAHTLKGLALNFSMSRLLNNLEPMVDLLRNESMDGTELYWEEVKKEYEILCDLIQELE